MRAAWLAVGLLACADQPGGPSGADPPGADPHAGHAAGSQPIAGSQPMGAGSQPMAAGSQPMGAGSQPMGAGSQPMGAGSQPMWHDPTLPTGHAEVQVAPDRLQLIGVRLARAEKTLLTPRLRASGVVVPDETREAHIHSRLMGWVDRLHVNAVGQKIKKNEPLYSLYSQDLFAAQQEYVRARKAAPDLAEAAASRLRLWGVPDDQVKLIAEKGPQRTVTFRSPVEGTVLEKMIVRGHFLEPEMMLFRIADLSQVWIVAQVYEFESDRLDPEGTARVTVQGQAEPVEARVDYVYPTVDPVTRTVKVRLVAPNVDGRLRPGSFATVMLPLHALDGLTVPAEAVIDTGVEQLVYRSMGGGRFRPVAVTVGRRSAGRIEVRAGLAVGDEVVVGAQFLIDSESRLRAGQSAGHQH